MNRTPVRTTVDIEDYLNQKLGVRCVVQMHPTGPQQFLAIWSRQENGLPPKVMEVDVEYRSLESVLERASQQTVKDWGEGLQAYDPETVLRLCESRLDQAGVHCIIARHPLEEARYMALMSSNEHRIDLQGSTILGKPIEWFWLHDIAKLVAATYGT